MTKRSPKKTVAMIIRYFFFSLATLILVGMACAAMCGVAFALYINTYVRPNADLDLDSFGRNLTSVVVYVDKTTGREVELDTLHGVQNRFWVELDEIPVMLRKAFVSIEDERFETHNGVDWKRFIGAALNYLVPFRDNFGGGSTITQQLIKNVTGDDATSVKRKILEGVRALELEKKYKKEDILEQYLNTIYFGNGAYGVKAAALTYFNKELGDLTMAECVAIAGISKNPSKYDPIRFPEFNKERRVLVLNAMLKNGAITQSEYDRTVKADITVSFQVLEDRDEPQTYFMDALIDSVINDLHEKKGWSLEMSRQLLFTGGLRIVTTFDPEVQAKVDAVYTDTENFPGVLGKDGTMPQSAIVIMDPYTGHVVALYGGRGEKVGSRVLNRATQSRRSPGSAIKPLTVYAPAVEAGLITPISVLDDVPKDFAVDPKGWPSNYYHSYRGRMTVAKAVEISNNTIPVELLQRMTPQSAFSFAYTNLGMTSLVDRKVKTSSTGVEKVYTDIDYSPLALGGMTDGVTVLEMAGAYSTFVNDGLYAEPVLYTKVYDANGQILLDNEPIMTEAMSAKTATYMIELMKGAVYGSEGTARRARLDGIEVAAKTGTTNSDYDRYFVGLTPYYVGVVWFGYDKPQEVKGVDGNPALYLWTEVMTAVHEGLEPRDFAQSTPLKKVSYCLDSGMIPTEWCHADPRGSRVASGYVAEGDEPKHQCQVHVPVKYDSVTGMLANEYCPVDDVVEIGLLNLERIFPSPSVYVTDQQYVVPIEVLSPGMYVALAPGSADKPPVNCTCTVHSIDNDGNAPEPIEPTEPTDPTEPQDPAAPSGPGGTDPTEPTDVTLPPEPTTGEETQPTESQPAA